MCGFIPSPVREGSTGFGDHSFDSSGRQPEDILAQSTIG